MRILKVIITLVVALVGWLLLTEWRPDVEERESVECEAVRLPDTLTLVSWNIGYGGLGEGMDFFYDGGSQTRASEEESRHNLEVIIAQLKAFDEADFILLQEVDISSRRSYGVNQYQRIVEALDFEYSAVALNYNSPFVPIPLREPMGRVKSGVVILSKYPFAQSIRRQYPSMPPLPSRLFDLKRAMLSVAIPTSKGDTLWINNTHNSAFDEGDMRRKEVAFIGDVIGAMPHSITAGDWNSTPPLYAQSVKSQQNIHFSPLPLVTDDLPVGVTVAADVECESMRYLDEPYIKYKTTTSLVDFAILGQKITLIECKNLNLEFKNSDHNPVVVTFLY